jgi:hypothetical protein
MRNRLSFLIALSLASQQASFAQEGVFQHSILGALRSITASTVPSNGDVNPYGVVFVPAAFPAGATAPGDALVANFNNSDNIQGTGATIVSISPAGQQTVFATSSLIGLDTALGVLSRGFVVVGNVPVKNGTPGQGSLQIFDHNGKLVTALNDSSLLDSPWDLSVNDKGSQAQIFVSNVLSGAVTRLDVSVSTTQVTVTDKFQIASGYGRAPNASAVVVGPTGLAYDPERDVLYLASTDDNKTFAVANAGGRTSSAGQGSVVFSDPQHLHGPLGLVLAPNGDLITANGDAVNAGGTPNDLVEFTPQGFLVATYQLDGGAPGAAFGIAISASQSNASQGDEGNGSQGLKFAAVDDDLNTVTVWTLGSKS